MRHAPKKRPRVCSHPPFGACRVGSPRSKSTRSTKAAQALGDLSALASRLGLVRSHAPDRMHVLEGVKRGPSTGRGLTPPSERLQRWAIGRVANALVAPLRLVARDADAYLVWVRNPRMQRLLRRGCALCRSVRF